MNLEKETWNEEKIVKALKEMIAVTKQKTMPTHSEIKEFYGNYKLTNAMRRIKGTKYYADVLGLEIKSCESNFGDKLEDYCLAQLDNMGLFAEKTKVRYPYDILVERAVKIDVKSSRKFDSYHNSQYYTFNIEKKEQTCDMYICYCVDTDDKIEKTMVIPSYILSGKTQLSIGIKESKYDKYIDRWDLLIKYCNFVKSLGA